MTWRGSAPADIAEIASLLIWAFSTNGGNLARVGAACDALVSLRRVYLSGRSGRIPIFSVHSPRMGLPVLQCGSADLAVKSRCCRRQIHASGGGARRVLAAFDLVVGVKPMACASGGC